MQDKEDRENREEFVHLATTSWNPCITLPDSQGREDELLKLEKYLVSVKDLGKYERRASTALCSAKVALIKTALSQFDSKEQLASKDQRWGWSPLFQTLKSTLP